MPFVTRQDGLRMHYRISGDIKRAPPVVLIQGLGLSSHFWFDLPDRLSRDPEQPFSVLLPDNRGTGASDLPRRRFSIADMADDVALMLEAQGIARAMIVGISLGGMIAQQFALRHADRVAGLVLMATTPGLPSGRIPPLRSLATLLSMPLRGRDARHMAAMARLMLPRAHWHRAGEIFAPWGPLMAQNPVAPASFALQFMAAVTHSTGAHLHRISAPTQIIHGDSDALIPARNAHILQTRIPGAELEILRDVGHAVPAQDKEAVRRALMRLLTRDVH